MIAAIGTHDKKNMHNDHVGDSAYFAIYEISDSNYRLLEYRKNGSPEEETHGDPKKAAAIMKIIKGCDILVGRAMGPNFIRIRDNSPYLPVIVRNEMSVEGAASQLVKNYERVNAALEAKRAGTYDRKPVIIE